RRYKGLLNLIRAFEIVRRTAPEARLVIVGKPVEDFKIYADEIEERGIKDSVDTVLEYVPFNEIQDIFSRADIVALPYEKIYQSGVLQLAYAFGKPVVVTRTGGLPEAVDEGKTGFIVPPADPRELSKALTTLIKNSSLCREMGKEALKKAHTSFSWERIAEITDKLYRSILSSI
ncbi:MAG: glycosyltransferase family 4 protein, partial [Candidatus Omnitrophica bacterium]|nr:glycosyltransferase family 4 protein [Candidatus Omnitrophota bacterium]